MPGTYEHKTDREKGQDALRFAMELYQQTPDWITFFRELLGVDGEINKLFTTREELEEFKKTEEYSEIQQMVARLRVASSESKDDSKEPTRVITVRMPQSLHESLRAEAHDRQTSMNKLCISKLLQVISEQLVPND